MNESVSTTASESVPARPIDFMELISRAAAVVAIAAVVGTFLLISPPNEQTYPGAIPWGPTSLLKGITDAMSLGGVFPTARGVEIKDVLLYGCAALGWLLVALRWWTAPPRLDIPQRALWYGGQVFLAVWVLLSLASAWWAGDAGLALGQGAIYFLHVSWAVSLGWLLRPRHAWWVVRGVMVAGALGGALCVWYYYERNPFHRPGFPIGNPSVLGACVLPALVLMLGYLASGVHGWWVRERGGLARMAWALLLLPAGWCFWMASSRAAMVGLVGGVLFTAFLRARGWLRVGLLALALAGMFGGGWYITNATQDFALARGETIRFRFYAWNYAATLWGQRAISGVGAGQYPRLATQLVANDMRLDPAAFQGDIVEHAHNELFEVLSEIGLVGGVSFVGAFVAILAMASRLLTRTPNRSERWLLAGVVAAVCALLVDSMFGVTLRLPGGPALFFTLLGVLWALAREHPARREQATGPVALPGSVSRDVARFVSVGALFLGALGIWLAQRHAIGLHDEWSAYEGIRTAVATGEPPAFQDAYEQAQAAERRLLTPVRKLLAHVLAVEVQKQAALREVTRLAAAVAGVEQGTLAPEQVRAALEGLVGLLDGLEFAALQFAQRAPQVANVVGTAAWANEQSIRPRLALGDKSGAESAMRDAIAQWRLQRALRPFNRDALLALTRFDATTQAVDERVALLRDVLRNGQIDVQWDAALTRLQQTAGFAAQLREMAAQIRPYGPQTEPDALLLSRAPEMLRLEAHWLAKQTPPDFETAAERAGRAAALYAALRMRVPRLESVALAEQAYFLLRADPRDVAAVRRVAERGLARLPKIQKQKYDALARPHREQLVRVALAAGDEAAATEYARVLAATIAGAPAVRDILSEEYLRLVRWTARNASERDLAARWAERATVLAPTVPDGWAWRAWCAAADGDAAGAAAILRQAREAGIPAATIDSIRGDLLKEFGAATQPASQLP